MVDRAADWQFLTASIDSDGKPDFLGIHLRNTQSGRVELHAVSAASGYRNWIAHVATAFDAVPDGQWQFAVASAGGSGSADLIGIDYGWSGSGRVEVHTLTAASNYQAFTVHAATPIGVVPAGSWSWLVADPRGSQDLVGVAHQWTGSGRTEVHVLSSASNYQGFVFHAATPLGYTTDTQWRFTLGDHDGDGAADLYAVVMNGSGSGSTEAHVVSAASNFGQWIVHAVTPLGYTTPANFSVDAGL